MKYWITVVDDDSLNRMKAERILSFNGYKVNCLASGEELLSFLKESRRNRPDLILLDVHTEDQKRKEHTGYIPYCR